MFMFFMFFWLDNVFLGVLVETHVEGKVKPKNPRFKRVPCGYERNAVAFIVAMR